MWDTWLVCLFCLFFPLICGFLLLTSLLILSPNLLLMLLSVLRCSAWLVQICLGRPHQHISLFGLVFCSKSIIKSFLCYYVPHYQECLIVAFVEQTHNSMPQKPSRVVGSGWFCIWENKATHMTAFLAWCSQWLWHMKVVTNFLPRCFTLTWLIISLFFQAVFPPVLVTMYFAVSKLMHFQAF